MILDNLIIKNFGVFRDEHQIDLLPKSKKAPIILIGGLNGGGKTTILDAIQLVLFGKLSKCSTRGNLPYEEFLRRCITRGVDPKEGAFVQLSFSYYFDGEPNEYTIARCWSENRNRVSENLIVYRNGDEDEALAENWLEQVDQFLPLGLAELFFFDGEKIARLAESENAAEMLSSAINTLLGIDLVDRLEKDLATYEKEIRESGKADTDDGTIEELESRTQQLATQIHKLAQDKGQIRVALEQANKKLKDAENKFKKQGGELFSKRKEFEASLRELESQKKRLEIEMRAIAGSEAPLALVARQLELIKTQAKKEEEAKKQHLLLNELEERDLKILDKMKGDKISKTAQTTLESLFQSDIQHRRKTASTTQVLKLNEQTANSVFAVNDSFFSASKKQIQSGIKELETVQDRIQRTKDRLSQVPDEAAISDQGKDLAKTRTNSIRKEAELTAAEEQFDELNKKQAETEKRLRKELEKRLEHHSESSILQRKLLYAAKTRETMRQFKTIVLKRKIKQIEEEILNCFQKLLRKKSLIAGISIDPETYRIELQGHGPASSIPTDRLSAGERQLLAIATLWGLARVSGRPLPNIIDTPLGRLDSKHRTNLVDNYFPNASHQVIILSTDEEINQSYLNRIKSRVGTSYELYYDDDSNSTEIKDGYFFD